MDATILLVEDEPRMRSLIADYLLKEEMAVEEAEDGQQAIEKFRHGKYELVVLDIMLPCLDGWTVCRAIRRTSNVPIIMLTARGDEDDKLMGYELGADDYITKPFSPKVLVAKIKALLRRTEGQQLEEGQITVRGLTINRLSHEVRVDGEEVSLSPKEYELLLYLARNAGIVLSREKLLNSVWGYEYYGDSRTVDTHIKRLREKLGSGAELVSTIRGCGYRLEVKK